MTGSRVLHFAASAAILKPATFRVLSLLAAMSLGACATTYSVRTEEQAVTIAKKACAPKVQYLPGIPESWTATADGTRWEVRHLVGDFVDATVEIDAATGRYTACHGIES